jgi:hypothetical protein
MPIDPYFNIVIVGTMLLIAVGLVYLVWLAATRQRRGRHLEQQVVGQIATLLNQHLPLDQGLKAPLWPSTGSCANAWSVSPARSPKADRCPALSAVPCRNVPVRLTVSPTSAGAPSPCPTP